ncbi:MAG TPA: DUF5682 family protein [Gemmataceae bacterium]|nr:DUF5682 family protein [Gemmataceae bacterium]
MIHIPKRVQSARFCEAGLNGGSNLTWKINVFGVRHLSPTGAWHLCRFLDRVRPKVVLIEGLADADELIPHFTRKGTKPPVAILAYTDAMPVRTLVYPLARYSPEYQAMKWADDHKARVEFIDLPSDIFLAFQDLEAVRVIRRAKEAEDDREGEAPAEPAESESPQELWRPERTESIYERIASRCGEPDYDTYWERRFEHNLADESYRLAAHELGRELRDEEDPPLWRAENLVREAYMRRRIAEVIASGVKPEQIVAVVGAFHAPVLTGDHPAMTDDELASLGRRGSKLTLMPYSYFKLSSQSGYGAGNRAPAYFELLWETLEAGDLHELPLRYLSNVARFMREKGTHRSTAEVIEGVRLARTLSALHEGMAPTLHDLRDAAVTLIGHGELSSVSEALSQVDVGTAIGALPKGVSQTSIQSDFERELDRLKLEKYRTTVKQELTLDLRENRRAKTADAAFLDLDRSSFFHRLRVLNIGFATPSKSNQQSATWAEKWFLQWSPESEIALVEAVLLGETVELATGFKFKTQLEACKTIAEAADLVNDACQCGLMKAMDLARRRLQELAANSTDLKAIAHATFQLSQVVRYGDVRKFDPAPLMPLMEELFVQGALSLQGAANCDNTSAQALLVSVDEMNRVSLEHHDRVEEQLWIDRLKMLSDADDRNPLLSGYACATLLERGLIANEDLAREVSRRLSPGIPADLGAGWFEGLAKRNRYSLLARQPLWQELALYIRSLDDDQFKRALVFLRRAFGGFSPQEKRHICENLGEIWGTGADAASEALEQPLTEKEEEKLKELSEFDFEDL